MLDNWIFDKQSIHSYWRYKEGIRYCEYDVKAFIEWLNEFRLNNNEEKAGIVKTHVKIDPDLKSLYFL